MIEAILILNLSTNTLCAGQKCWPVITNKTQTLKITYEVEGIYLNSDMLTPNGAVLKASAFGGKIIDLRNTDIAIHSWLEPFTPQMQSSGCIRMNKADIDELINTYYFNEIIVIDA